MSKKFISFLGTGKYEVTHYIHNNVDMEGYISRFIQEALIKTICKEWGRSDKAIVFITEEAKKLGNSRVFNVIVLGIAAQHMDFTKEEWLDVIEKTVPAKTIEINKKAFEVGYNLNR